MWIIYSFHMPAFIFISGYFSKKETFREMFSSSVIRFLVLFLFIQTLYDFFNHFWFGNRISFDYHIPNFTLWFLCSMIFWKVALQVVIRWKWSLVVFGLLFLTHRFWIPDLSVVAIGRSISFSFFFFIGYYAKPLIQHFIAFKPLSERPLLTKLIGLFGFISVFTLYKVGVINIPTQWFFGYFKNFDLDYSIGYLVFYQVVVFVLSAIMIAFFFMMVPKKEYDWTKYGKFTLTVYLLHGFIRHVMVREDLLLTFDTFGHVFVGLTISIFIVYVLSQPIFNNFVNAIFSLTTPKIKKTKEV